MGPTWSIIIATCPFFFQSPSSRSDFNESLTTMLRHLLKWRSSYSDHVHTSTYRYCHLSLRDNAVAESQLISFAFTECLGYQLCVSASREGSRKAGMLADYGRPYFCFESAAPLAVLSACHAEPCRAQTVSASTLVHGSHLQLAVVARTSKVPT